MTCSTSRFDRDTVACLSNRQARVVMLSQTGVFPASGACSLLKRFTQLETHPAM
jgi:hypothetical protein